MVTQRNLRSKSIEIGCNMFIYLDTRERLQRLEMVLMNILEVKLESCGGSTVMFDEQMLNNR